MMYLLGFTAMQVEKMMSGSRPPSPWEVSHRLLEMQVWMLGVVAVMLFLILLVLGVTRPRK